GVNLFVAASVAKLKLEKLFKPILPLLITMLFVLILVTYIPQVSLWLTGFMR
ncbi:TRAP transporter large permease subunit, partial [Virgibacillus sp. W0430]|uniref:TRAP transporter large permease subunit n=1 Tax=Virgibacillus sp. W0430 TaxID=3391580 RepID=UPI003F47E453